MSSNYSNNKCINNNNDKNDNFQKDNNNNSNNDDKYKKKPSESNAASFRELRLSKYYVEVLIDKSPDVLGTPLNSEKRLAGQQSINLLSLKPSGNSVVNGSVVNASVVNGNVINGSVVNGNVVNLPEMKSGGDEDSNSIKRSSVAYGRGMTDNRSNNSPNDDLMYTSRSQHQEDIDIDSDDGFGNEMGKPTFEKYNYGDRRSNYHSNKNKNKKGKRDNRSSPNRNSAQNTNFKGKKNKGGGAVSKTIPIFDEEQCKADFKSAIAQKQQMKFHQNKQLSQATNKVSNLSEELEVVSNQIEHHNKKLFEWTYGYLDLNFENMLVRNKRERKSQIINNLNNLIVNLSFKEDRLKIQLKKARKCVKQIEKKIREIESFLASDIYAYNYNFT